MPLGKAMQGIAISQGSLSSHISDFLIIKRQAGKPFYELDYYIRGDMI